MRPSPESGLTRFSIGLGKTLAQSEVIRWPVK
jgi:hypothetical protein